MINLIPLQFPNLVKIKDPANIMESIIKEAAKLPDLRHQIKPECLKPGYEYEWTRVQRMRAERHPLMSGGKKS